jgi:hypothetical protein
MHQLVGGLLAGVRADEHRHLLLEPQPTHALGELVGDAGERDPQPVRQVAEPEPRQPGPQDVAAVALVLRHRERHQHPAVVGAGAGGGGEDAAVGLVEQRLGAVGNR